MSDRVMKRVWNSPWLDLMIAIVLIYGYTDQLGWQRWLFFAGSIMSIISFTLQGNRRWTK